jgi:predicted permease
MRPLRAWAIRLAGAFRGKEREEQFDAELASHLEMHVEENLRRGMTPEEARRQALLALGGGHLRDEYRDRGGVPLVESLAQDVRFAIRMLRKSPGFTAVAVIVLAVGVGASATVFSLVNAVLLRPLNRGADVALVSVYIGAPARPNGFRSFRYDEYVELRDRSDPFEAVIAEQRARAALAENGLTRRVSLTLVSANYFPAFGVPMAAGRPFTRDEERPGSRAAVAVVAYRYWRARGLRPDIIGERIVLNDRPFEIVGVAAEGFNGTVPLIVSEIWLPLGASSLVGREEGTLMLAAMLKPGVSPAEAQARLAPVAAGLAAAYPESNRDHELLVRRRSRTGISVAPSSDTEARMAGSVLTLFSGLVLVVGCLNLANILLARGNVRQGEIAVRLAIGGSRWRIVRQLLVEGALLSAMGGAAAVGIAWLVANRVVASLAGIMPTAVTLDVAPDGRVLAMIAASCVLSTVFFCLGPSWRMSRLDLVTAIKSTGLRAGSPRRISVPGLLVAAQVCVSLALLVSAGVFLRASVNAASREPGFPLDGRLLATLDASLALLDDAEGRQRYLQTLEAVRALPGVRQASAASIVAFGPRSEARQVFRGRESTWPTFVVVGRDYFATLGLTLIAGREFTAAEEAGAAGEPVAIVDDALVERFFPGGNPLGQTLRVAFREDGTGGDVVRIVGVVPAVPDDILEPAGPHLYVPFGRHYRGDMTLHVLTTDGSAAAMLASVRGAIQGLSRPLPIVSMRTMVEHRDGTPTLWAISLAARSFGAFGAIALVLAAVGVYGLRAYLVAQRSREFAIRTALGASRGGMLAQLLRESAAVAAAGMGAGLVLAVALVQLLRQSEMLYQVGAVDPLVFTTASLLLGLAVTAASYVPARTALRSDAAAALRPE